MGDVVKVGGSDPWRWVVLVSGFFNMVIHSSVNYNAGVINDAVIDTFHTGTVEASWLTSYYSALFAIASPLASALILLTDCRTCVIMSGFLGLAGFACSSLVGSLPVLYLTLGLAGIGQSLCQAGNLLILSYYFPDNLPLVHGVCLAGSGMGSFVHPVLTQLFIDTWGFYGTMLMLAALCFHSTMLGMLFRTTTLEKKSKDFLTKPDRSNKLKTIASKVIPSAEIFKIPAFLTLITSIWFFSVAFQSMVVMLPNYAKQYVGLSIQEGSVAAMILGAGSVSSRLLSGIAASHENIGETVLFVGIAGVLSVLSFCGNFIMDLHKGAYIFSFLFGLYSGGLVPLSNTMLMKIVGLELSAHGYGVMMFTFGVAGFVGPPFIAFLVETEGPHMLFTLCGVISLLVSALGLLTINLEKSPTDGTSIKDLTKVKDISIDVTQDGDDENDIQATKPLMVEREDPPRRQIYTDDDHDNDEDDNVDVRTGCEVEGAVANGVRWPSG